MRVCDTQSGFTLSVLVASAALNVQRNASNSVNVIDAEAIGGCPLLPARRARNQQDAASQSECRCHWCSVNPITRLAPTGTTRGNVTPAGGLNQLTGDGIGQVVGDFGRRFGANQRDGIQLGGSWLRTTAGCFDSSDDCEGAWMCWRVSNSVVKPY
jgi:hypothetical protein